MTVSSPPELAALTLPRGLPAFPALRSLQVLPRGGAGSPMVILRSEVPPVCFVAARPEAFFPGYRPALPYDLLADLGVAGGGEEILVLLTMGGTLRDTTANLLGPLVLNPRTGRCHQVVLGDSAWSATTPLTSG